MTAWTSDELDKIGTADELEIASVGRDGTLRKPVTIWVVRVGDDPYVRSYKGRGGSWFRAAQVRHEGRIRGGRSRKRRHLLGGNRPRHERPDRCRVPQQVPRLWRALRRSDGGCGGTRHDDQTRAPLNESRNRPLGLLELRGTRALGTELEG